MSSYRGSKVWMTRAAASLGLLLIATASLAEDPQPAGARADAVASRAAAPNTPPSSAPAEPGTMRVLCVNSVQCFQARAPAAAANEPARAALDLRAPDIHRVFSADELQQVIEEPDDVIYRTETVQVEGERPLNPVSIGIMAIPWAIMHPTQAWRILMPMPSAK
jgi:hypothetical protein